MISIFSFNISTQEIFFQSQYSNEGKQELHRQVLLLKHIYGSCLVS